MSANDWSEQLRDADGFVLQPPSTRAVVEDAETRLGVTFPIELRALLLTTDGVFDSTGQWYVIWPLERIVQENLAAWELEGPPRAQWLGFGDDGTGSPFCVARVEGSEVSYWLPIDGEPTMLADSLRVFWEAWINGAIHT